MFGKAGNFGIDLFAVNFPERGNVFTTGKQIFDFIVRNKISIVHTNVNYDRTVAGFAAKLAGAKHIAMVHSHHSISHNLTHYVRNRYYTDHFLVDGYCTKKLLNEKDGIENDLLKVVQLGIEPEEMKRDSMLRKKIRTGFGIDDSTVLFGNVGRLVEFKGQEFLIKAFYDVCRVHRDAALIIVGDGKLEKKLKEQTENLGIADKVIFTGFRDDLQALYSAFDIYVHSSVEGGGEAFPFSVLYSLAQGIPSIVTDVGDVSKMIKQDISGFSVSGGSPELLAEKMLFFLNDKEKINVFGKNALKLLLENFTCDKAFSRILEVYEYVSRN